MIKPKDKRVKITLEDLGRIVCVSAEGLDSVRLPNFTVCGIETLERVVTSMEKKLAIRDADVGEWATQST
jgi:hypothetical protein